jgi:hypothetical protein
MGNFKQEDMLYDDGSYYKWTAKADQDNPKFRSGTDAAQLNRTEGYEVLHFINSFGDKFFNSKPTKLTFQKVERMIHDNVPSHITIHSGIQNWIVKNWDSF